MRMMDSNINVTNKDIVNNPDQGSFCIEIKNLNYTYPDGNRALEGINLEVRKGECLGIIGPNAAGKTTLLLHLNGLLISESAQEIRVMGIKICNKHLKEIRKTVGFVFQEPQDQLFMPTVYEDVSFGPVNLGWDKEIVEKQTKQALKQVGLYDKAGHLSHHLSLGQKKRVAIATVISMKPEILVLDEPSANLDPAARSSLIELLKGLAVTKIISGHDLELILELTNRVIVLDRGRIVANGNTREILSNNHIMQQHGLQVPLSLKLPRNQGQFSSLLSPDRCPL